MATIDLQSPVFLWGLPLLWLLLLLFAWRRHFKPLGAMLLRLAIVVLAVLALARPVYLPPPAAAPGDEYQSHLVALVDQSAGLDAAEQQMLREEAGRLAGEFDSSTVLYFADRALLATPGSGQEEIPLNGEVSNLAEALTMGARLLKNQPGRLVLLSDGFATEGDTIEAARQLAGQGIRVDTVGLPAPRLQAGPEIRLVDLRVPPSLREGEAFSIDLVIHSSHQAEATLNLAQGETVLAEDVVPLDPGLNPFTFEANALGIGLHTFRAVVAVEVEDDGQPVNNSLAAFTQVYPAPRILVVGDDREQTVRFAGYLANAGFDPATMVPGQLPDRLSRLEDYAGMVLLNISARSLELEQMIAVQEFVRSLGRGLLVTGGRNSFSLGSYEDTPLADLLPLSMEPPPREERPPVVLLLVIDHSGSMVERAVTTKLVMAKEAAIRATDILGPEDRIGVLMFDDEFDWIVPFQPVSDGAALLEIQRRIATIPAGGGTHILTALEESLPALAQQEVPGGARHAVLLTDGRSFDGTRGLADYDQLIEEALRVNITLSTIAIGQGADQDLLAHLAERGLGRYHFAAEPEELPALTIAESAILRSNAVQEGDFKPAVYAPHPLLRGLFSAGNVESELPELSGYVAMTPKPRAEIALQAGPGDPLLTTWGYGLGRVVAWSSDTGNDWTPAWLNWPMTARFWGQMMGYTLPAPDLGLLQVQAEVGPQGEVTLTAAGVTATGQTVDLVSTQAALVTPAGRRVTVHLRQTAPGRYQQRLLLPDPGAYEVRVIQERTGGELDEKATIGFVVPYPAEYGLPAEGTGRPLLEQIADISGGRYLDLSESAAAMTPAITPDDPARRARELWPWLLLAALVLWPIEIAWRRWGRLRIQ